MALPGMQLVFHGGKCCGIKTIYNMGYGPKCLTDKSPALEAIKRDDRDQCGQDCSSSDRFFHEEAPAESNVDRLDRYIAYMKKRRPCNILEIVLASQKEPSTYWCQHHWEPTLLERGFKLVNSHQNSNSGNICSVYHLNIDEDYPGKDDGDSCDDDYDEEDDEGEICDCGCGMRL